MATEEGSQLPPFFLFYRLWLVRFVSFASVADTETCRNLQLKSKKLCKMSPKVVFGKNKLLQRILGL